MDFVQYTISLNVSVALGCLVLVSQGAFVRDQRWKLMLPAQSRTANATLLNSYHRHTPSRVFANESIMQTCSIKTLFYNLSRDLHTISCKKMDDACRSPVRVSVAVVRNDPRADASFPHLFGNLRLTPGGGRAHFCETRTIHQDARQQAKDRSIGWLELTGAPPMSRISSCAAQAQHGSSAVRTTESQTPIGRPVG